MSQQIGFICRRCNEKDTKIITSFKNQKWIYRKLQCKTCSMYFVIYTDYQNNVLSYNNPPGVIQKKARRIDISRVPKEKISDLLWNPHPKRDNENFYF